MNEALSPPLTVWRAWAQIAAVIALTLSGLVLGGLTPWPALSSILGMALPLLAATLFLRSEGRRWRDLGFATAMPPAAFVRYTLITLASIYLITNFVVTPLMRAAGAEALQAGELIELIEGNLGGYLTFLLPVTWGSAAFGEELLARGFLLHRFAGLFGSRAAVVLQAVVFALGHFYQGPTGMANVLVVGLVMGAVYLRCGRNLWPVIAAHGVIDTIAMTLIYLGYADLLTGSQ
ncbi:MAG: type II CAAX endopeptidase family protein [Pseudomonadales bacterium]